MMEHKLTRKSVALICFLTKWDILSKYADEECLDIVNGIIEICQNVKDDVNAKDGE